MLKFIFISLISFLSIIGCLTLGFIFFDDSNTTNNVSEKNPPAIYSTVAPENVVSPIEAPEELLQETQENVTTPKSIPEKKYSPQEEVYTPAEITTPVSNAKYGQYAWLTNYNEAATIARRIVLPEGYRRLPLNEGSFAHWLRNLPLKPEGSKVKLYDGSLKDRQDVHAAIIDIDPGKEDLQQCADACMRLKAEYHYSKGEHSKIHFKFTSGDNAVWTQWREGYRPIINGNNVSWKKTANYDDSYKNFKSYLTTVFRYAGTASLSKELAVAQKENILAGDLFIQGGFPGHAVIVLDVAENIQTKEKIFLLAQSYMPAQEIHILNNFNDEDMSPWYSTNFVDELDTPEWTFEGNCLKRFR